MLDWCVQQLLGCGRFDCFDELCDVIGKDAIDRLKRYVQNRFAAAEHWRIGKTKGNRSSRSDQLWVAEGIPNDPDVAAAGITDIGFFTKWIVADSVLDEAVVSGHKRVAQVTAYRDSLRAVDRECLVWIEGVQVSVLHLSGKLIDRIISHDQRAESGFITMPVRKGDLIGL